MLLIRNSGVLLVLLLVFCSVLVVVQVSVITFLLRHDCNALKKISHERKNCVKKSKSN